jgi:uncharacterized protein with GYD domain
MATFLVLNKVTEQGAKNLTDSSKLVAGIRGDIERGGGKLLGMYVTQGQYDSVLLVEHPNEYEFMAGLLRANALGAIHSETLRAYDEREMQEIGSRLGGRATAPVG